MGKYKTMISGLPVLRHFIDFTKRVSLPSFEGVSIYDVSSFLVREILRDAITVRASSIAFSFLIAIFPSIIFLFTLLPYIPIENLEEIMLGFMSDVMPKNAYLMLESTVSDMMQIQRGGLLSFGLILALFFSTNGMNSMIDSFDKSYVYESFKSRSYLKQRLVALYLTLVMSVLVIFSVVMIVAGNAFLNWVLDVLGLREVMGYWAVSSFRWLVMVSLFYFSFAFIYYIGPATKKNWRFFSPGCTIATLLVILTSMSFSLYVNNWGQYNNIYGSIGTLIVAMLWIYFNSMVLLIGFELNTAIYVNKNLKATQE